MANEAQLTVTQKAEGGYILLAAKGCPTVKAKITTADQAVAAWEAYRDGNGLGASDMKRGCGDIRTDSGKLVARVTYNGRIWDANGNCLQDISGGFTLIAE